MSGDEGIRGVISVIKDDSQPINSHGGPLSYSFDRDKVGERKLNYSGAPGYQA
jgi:hypothetical protein